MNAIALPSRPPGLVSSLVELTKLRISGASTFTAAAGYIAYRRGADPGLATALLGILLLAMGASAINEIQERHLDAQMERTRMRPLPRGVFTPAAAGAIAGLLAASGFLVLLAAHNLTTALLGALALLWYNGLYTPLKRVSAFAVVPGALIGALPPAIGWTAAGGAPLDPAVLALAFVFFIWQVPHFWLLVCLHAEGYEGAGFPTLKTLLGVRGLSRLTFTWICATAASCALLPAFRVTLSLPAHLALLGGALGLVLSSGLLLRPDGEPALFRKVFMRINVFALVVTFAVILDPLLSR